MISTPASFRFRLPPPAVIVLVFALASAWLAASLEAQPRRGGGGRERGGPPAEAQAEGESAETGPGEAQEATAALPESWLKAMPWRSIGPANMGGRITSITVSHQDRSTYWIGTASGGLLKTTNNGTTYTHQFDGQDTVSIGDVEVAPSDPNILWIGTGEANPRNSVSWGDGVYKSTDGGETWTHKGLEKTFQIGRIAIHPTDPDIVYVGALGRLWGPSEDRGLYKTEDGGETWKKILFIDDKAGIIDVQLQPDDPNTLLVAAYERQRDGFDTNDPAKKWGPGSGLYRSADAGRSFQKITAGLPTVMHGRIGFDFYVKDPNVVYMVLESEKITQQPENAAWMGIAGEDADSGARLTEITVGGPAEKAGLKAGDIVIRVEDKAILSFNDLTTEIGKRLAGDTVQMEISRDRRSVLVEVSFERQPEEQEDPERQGPPGGRGGGGGGGAGRGPAGGGGEGRRRERAARGESDRPESASESSGEAEAGTEESKAEEETKAGEETEEPEEARTEEEKKAEEKKAEERKAEERKEEDQREREAGPFSSGLGGQRENVHEQQGPDGYEYGGVYKSTDGGATWTRINSVNPRPMYYSQIRVDPSDDQFVYVLGTSLYRSKDGGATFTDDGHGREVHVDHHALWIDPVDGRHMILGNDGGIYVTYDRMERWDHHNRVAIGQFYRVTTDATVDYRVYGGLQDNGSWGGPNRVSDEDGPVNADWIRVGGGDGFFCQVDRDDPSLVYSESQNGATGRTNLRTGERGSLRPRAPRGQQYRFNWNTPFLLSHHNTKIVYSAGNHVFRSLDRGEGMTAISPEITATDKGSATALSESPVDPGVLYVGTDDGALWMTNNGGHDWIDLRAVELESEAPAKDAPAGGRGRRRIAASSDGAAETTNGDGAGPGDANGAGGGSENGTPQNGAAPMAADDPDPLVGVWDARVVMEEVPEDQGRFTIDMTRSEDGTIGGRVTSQMSDGAISSVTFDASTGALTFKTRSSEMTVEFFATVKGDAMTGTILIPGVPPIEFSAERPPREEPPAASEERPGGGERREERAGGAGRRRGRGASGGDAGPGTGQTIAMLVPEPRWVSSVHASRFKAERVYLTLDGHRSDDDALHAFASEDHGHTWTSLTASIPQSAGSTRALVEDRANENVLYLGCEFSAWVSIDRGATWTSFTTAGNLPTVAVHDFAQSPAVDDLVAATHGRSLWILDVSALRQMSSETVTADFHLYAPRRAILWRNGYERGRNGLSAFVGENPEEGAKIVYSLGRQARSVELAVTDLAGRTIRTLEPDGGAGLHVVSWDLREPGQEVQGRRGRFFRRGRRVDPGTYRVVLTVGNTTVVEMLEVTMDPGHTDRAWLDAEREADAEWTPWDEEEDGGDAVERRIF